MRRIGGERIDDLGDDLARVDPSAELRLVDEDAGGGCVERLDRGERARLASRGRERPRLAGKEAAARQEAQKGRGVGGGERIAHIAMAAIFDGGRHAGVGDRVGCSEKPAQLRPDIAEDLIERIAAGLGGEQGRKAADFG